MDTPVTRTVQDLPERFRSLFTCYPEFNRVQSAVFPDLMESNDSIVVTAPTGSGKTVLFELAIVNLMNTCPDVGKMKAVYVAPVKALCSERFADWSLKFEPLGLSCIEVTGDSMDDVNLQSYQVILTTPEKWDSLTRRWRENVNFVHMVKLILIDEVHLLSDETRGPTLETIVCRMKTLKTGIRFIAVSATIFNLEDLAQWFGDGRSPARMHKFGNEVRPVALRRVVKSYPQGNQGAYLFDIQLSYKLKQVLMDYSEGKPALVFCSTRRGVVQTCQTLVEQLQFQFTPEQRAMLVEVSNRIVDNKLKDFVRNGAGYHHAGMTTGDRHLIQEVFTQGSLPVLVATTTLAMGVNLPAHLVVIKSTYQYVAGSYCEYPETYILQMVGRAGRPQFDTTATAVIMTRNEMTNKYQNLLDCKEIMESSLHHNLAEHLNSEIVLYTITDLGVAMDWLRCTFLYQRAFKNPQFYGLNHSKIDKELEMMVLREMNALQNAELVELVNGMDVSPTPNGRLMSHYYLSLKTFQLFQKVDEKTTLPEILTLLSEAHEFNMIQLRVSEKRLLNELNSSKVSQVIRYPMQGKIKTREMKINCLTQAILGCLTIQDPALQQEALRIISLLERIAKCLVEYLSRKSSYCCFYNAVVLGKCLHAKMWENSLHVARQLDRIGAALGACLVSCGKTSFNVLIQSHPCELERIVNRGPPLGSHLIDQARRLPQYQLTVRLDQASVLNCTLLIGIEIENASLVSEQNTAGKRHAVFVIVGDTNNRLLHQRRVPDTTILRGGFRFTVFVNPPQPKKIFVKVVSEQWAGIDVDHEVLVNPMAKDLLNDDFKESRRKVTRKRAKKVDPVTFSPKILKILEGKPNKKRVSQSVEINDCCFDLEPNWQDFDAIPVDENVQDMNHIQPANVTEQETNTGENSKHDKMYQRIEPVIGIPGNFDRDAINGHFQNITRPKHVQNFNHQVVNRDFQDFDAFRNKPATAISNDLDSDDLGGNSTPWQITQMLEKLNNELPNQISSGVTKPPTNEIFTNCDNFERFENDIPENYEKYADYADVVPVNELLPKIPRPRVEPDAQDIHYFRPVTKDWQDFDAIPVDENVQDMNQIQPPNVTEPETNTRDNSEHDKMYQRIEPVNGIPGNFDRHAINGRFQNITRPKHVQNFNHQVVNRDFQDFDALRNKPATAISNDLESDDLAGNSTPWQITQILEKLNNELPNQISLGVTKQPTNEKFENYDNFERFENDIPENYEKYADYADAVPVNEFLPKIPRPRVEPDSQNFHFFQPVNKNWQDFEPDAQNFNNFPPLNHNWQDFEPGNEPVKNLQAPSAPWRITQIVEPFNPEPVSFQLFDSQQFLTQESPDPAQHEILKVTKNTVCCLTETKEIVRDSRRFPYHPKDVLWPTFIPEEHLKENIVPKRLELVQANAKPVNKLKSLKDFYPLVKAVRKLTKNINDEKCFY